MGTATQGDAQPGSLASSTSDAAMRDASEVSRAFRSVVSVLVRLPRST
jgi:hypothetical protein